MVEQLAEVLDTLSPVAEQVINVPKIILEDLPMRTLAREPQLVEQLVEVPTLPQTVGTPILALLRDFRPGGGQGPTAYGSTAVPAPKIQEQITTVVAVELWTSL